MTKNLLLSNAIPSKTVKRKWNLLTILYGIKNPKSNILLRTKTPPSEIIKHTKKTS